jgi:hypothetical protein
MQFLLAPGFSAEMLSTFVKLTSVVTEPMMEHRGATLTVERIHITNAHRMSLEGRPPLPKCSELPSNVIQLTLRRA